jgi:hypothetical protein
MNLIAWIAVLVVASASTSIGQEYRYSGDVGTIDAIIKAYYEVVSGPAGQPRDWARDRYLHHPNAQVAIVRNDSAGNVRVDVSDLATFHQGSAGLERTGFFEYEIHRQISRHGAIANVWSTYEWRMKEDGPVGGRGINSIQLVHDGKRWWILGWMFDGRSPAPELPMEYMPGKRTK